MLLEVKRNFNDFYKTCLGKQLAEMVAPETPWSLGRAASSLFETSPEISQLGAWALVAAAQVLQLLCSKTAALCFPQQLQELGAWGKNEGNWLGEL